MIDLQNRHFTSDEEIITDVIAENLTFLENVNSGWNKVYRENNSAVKWLLFHSDRENHGGGMKILGKLPFPETEILIDIALNSIYEDETIAACCVLVDNENTSDFRLSLIEELEKIADGHRQKLIIEYTELLSRHNRREIIGKSYDQVTEDARYFELIGRRAYVLSLR